MQDAKKKAKEFPPPPVEYIIHCIPYPMESRRQSGCLQERRKRERKKIHKRQKNIPFFKIEMFGCQMWREKISHAKMMNSFKLIDLSKFPKDFSHPFNGMNTIWKFTVKFSGNTLINFSIFLMVKYFFWYSHTIVSKFNFVRKAYISCNFVTNSLNTLKLN